MYVTGISSLAVLALSLALPAALPAASRDMQDIATLLAERTARDAQVARQIWEWAELGYKEKQSSALLQAELKAAGFTVTAGMAGMPTAFVATAGSGKPVIGMLAEFDALPGLSQDAVPQRSPHDARAPGHGCGHHLFGTASTSAAIAVRKWLASSRASGTIRVYGTPAEEGGAGKVYLVRAGLFDDVDAVLHWHPDSVNTASKPWTTWLTCCASTCRRRRASTTSSRVAAARPMSFPISPRCTTTCAIRIRACSMRSGRAW
jgi:aminobenzoyl-glutamate utilization protein B